MQVKNLNIICLFVFTSFLLLAEGLETQNRTLTLHPSWENNSSFYTSNFDGLTLIGSNAPFEIKQWEVWSKNVPLLPYHGKVIKVLFNHGSMSHEFAEYLCNFENIESLTLGISIEGVLLSEETFKVFSKMRKLKHLHIAIHGLNDSYLKNISLFTSLESLVIQFPDKNMIAENELHLWSKTCLSDLSLCEIAKIKSLRSFTIESFDAQYVRVDFSFPTIEKIIRLPDLEKFQIATSNFTLNRGRLVFSRETITEK